MGYRLRITDSHWSGCYIARKSRSHPNGCVGQAGMGTQYSTLKAAQGAASRIMSTRGLTCVPEPIVSPKKSGTTDAPATERGDVFHNKKEW